jgi:hypothetical protein
MPSNGDPVEIDQWFSRHGLPENQEGYFRYCLPLYPDLWNKHKPTSGTPASPSPPGRGKV